MSSLSDLFKIVKENSPSVILHDTDTDESLVVTTLEEYKKLKQTSTDRNTDELNRKEILKRINEDISALRKKHEAEKRKMAAQRIEDRAETESAPDFTSGGGFDFSGEETKNLTKIAQQQKEESKYDLEKAQLEDNEVEEPELKQEEQKEIPKRNELDKELELEEIEQTPQQDLDSSAISYEELDDDLK